MKNKLDVFLLVSGSLYQEVVDNIDLDKVRETYDNENIQIFTSKVSEDDTLIAGVGLNRNKIAKSNKLKYLLDVEREVKYIIIPAMDVTFLLMLAEIVIDDDVLYIEFSESKFRKLLKSKKMKKFILEHVNDREFVKSVIPDAYK